MINKGSCLCNKVKYEIDGELKDVLNCHCSMCRKLHGAAFRTRAQINSTDWRTIEGKEFIKFYESSPGEHKGFCSECGSNLYTKFDAKPNVLGFPLGTLDTDPKVTPSRHIFVGSKAPWHEIADDLPQQREYE
ncbi:Glutathione-dependent formaldehyde-activating, GFA [Shewanella piezotolerans WP3]|uniref:Glutathione-dependent formaldehyde-activating, GFA n=1 Tax=Shewanella piezotolerans (strain WP3 / JCM 13877) TaxID=225849 RepID=B8CPV5_SHEPW|nr:GFA family protein [Shewanella piezotolerans]ACJ29818.1 Glutathione-dependent formaldehyde-activating, GFA [Shewanella piezotolerans WP3]